MIGWFIVVATKPREERARDPDEKDAVLASWEAGVEGLDWLDPLIAQGVAIKRQGGGYPNLYRAQAGPVIALLQDGPPAPTRGLEIIGDDYVMPAGWQGSVQVHTDRIRRCPRDIELVIEGWDLS